MVSLSMTLLMAVMTCVVFAMMVWIGFTYGRRAVTALLFWSFSAALSWAFIWGCAYEPNRGIKTLETVVCVVAFLYGLYCTIQEARDWGKRNDKKR